MSAINYLQHIKPARPALNGFYRARVEDNEDPRRLGRVRVRVWPFFFDDQVKEQDLPWAQPAWWMPLQIPPRHSWVWVFFENGDPQHPVYFAQALPLGVGRRLEIAPKTTDPQQAARQHLHPRTWVEEAAATYPGANIIRTPHGNLIKIDDATGEISIYSHTGNQLTMKPDGEVCLYSHTKSQLCLKANGDVVLHAANNLYIRAAGNIYLDDPMEPPRRKRWNE